MKISIPWLKELVDFQLSTEELAEQLSLSSLGVKQQTEDYLELDLTYNRGDLLSLRGVAYEVGALTDSPLRFLAPTPEDFTWVGKKLKKTPVKIESAELSEVQCVAKIEGLKVGPSPKEWIKKLTDSGMRSVNNIADVTNLVMLEFGQPLHAFDAGSVEDETIIVRRADIGEEITTLDGKLRKLNPGDIVLSDTKKPLDVAGIMGGKNTEVKKDTTAILLSASMFNPLMVRKTSKRLGLYSEASKRFQHGLSKMRLLQSFDATIRMYEEIGGKLTAINLEGDFNQERKIINLSREKLNNLLGISLDMETILTCLKKLNFTVTKKSSDSIEVMPPYFRVDIEIEEDLIEEIARMYGYEKIPGKPLKDSKPKKLDQSLQNFIHDLKVSCKKVGLTEVQTYPFFSTQIISNFKFQISNLVRVANPISSETEFLRTFLWPNLIEAVAKNIRAGFKDIAVFEIGKVYSPKEPREFYRLSVAIMNNTDNPAEELAAIFKSLASHIGSGNVKLKEGGMIKDKLETLFHPNRYANVERDGSPRFAGEAGKIIGGLAEVHPRFLNKFGIEKRVAILEISIEPIVS